MTALLSRRVEALEARNPSADQCITHFIHYVRPGATADQPAYERKPVGIRAAPLYGLPAIDLEPGEDWDDFQTRVSNRVIWPAGCNYAVVYARCADDPREERGEKDDLEQLRAIASIRLDDDGPL